MKTRYKLIISAILQLCAICVILFLVGCTDLFSVRDVEQPTGSQTTATAKTPEELINYFQNSLKNSNTALYLSILADSIQTGYEYSFSSDAQDVQPTAFNGWWKSQEKQFIERLFKSNYCRSVNFAVEPFDEPQQDTLQIKFVYQLEFAGQNQNSFFVKGKSLFVLIKKNSNWYLARWKDEFVTLNNTISFSKLKLDQSL